MAVMKFFCIGEGDDCVSIGRLRIGVVVEGTMFIDGTTKVPSGEFGHIVGFERNSTNELIVKVQWEAGCGEVPNVYSSHPSNLVLHL